MKLKLSLAIILTFILLSFQNSYSQDYKDLQDCFGKWTSVMEHYTKEMSPDADLSKISSCCIELADSVTFYYPKMIKIRNKYPEIVESGPPEKLKDFFTRYEMVESKYNEMLNALVKMVNNNPDNEALSKAYGALNMAVYNARK